MVKAYVYNEFMRYRLGKKDSHDNLKGYLKQRLFVLSSLASQLGISGNGFHNILNGETKRPDINLMRNLAKLTDMEIGFDDDGIFFEPSDSQNPKDAPSHTSSIPTTTHSEKDLLKKELLEEFSQQLSHLTTSQIDSLIKLAYDEDINLFAFFLNYTKLKAMEQESRDEQQRRSSEANVERDGL